MINVFAGKKLLVVGGTSGMGLETARVILEQGGSGISRLRPRTLG